MEKILGELMALIGIRFPNGEVKAARLFRSDFHVNSALSVDCDGYVVFVSCRFREDAVFSVPLGRRVSMSFLWPVWDLVYRPSSSLFVALLYVSSQWLLRPS